MIVVQLMKPVETVYGSGTCRMGTPHTVTARSSLESIRTARFPRTWAQDTTPQTTGGLREDALAIVLAPEWHGDINTQFWFDNACYEVDGPPMEMRHASDAAHHWNITARCIGHATKDNGLKPPVPPEGSRTWGT